MDLGKIKCTGTLVMKPLKEEDKKGKHYFISCSEWTRRDKDHHARSIPADIDEDILSTLFVNGSLIKAHGPWGATVQSVDNAPTTALILEGETPAIHDVALMDKRRKKDMIRQAKLKESPGGLDLNGVYLQHLKDSRELPVSQCYIHGVHHVNDYIMIITFDSFLLSLIHDAISFKVDHTFKRVRGYNKWDIVIFCDGIQHAITIGWVYTNGQDHYFYKHLFDEF
ncbi:hypothetical protein BDQ17DRAFT_1429695 [Cyathus striatus]|nr:hypothetical protein BDQ17DRAFT_1429695 [Cyathus striatus]